MGAGRQAVDGRRRLGLGGRRRRPGRGRHRQAADQGLPGSRSAHRTRCCAATPGPPRCGPIQDAILDLHCVKGGDCTLTAWDPRGTRPIWTVPTGDIGFVLHALEPGPAGHPAADVAPGGRRRGRGAVPARDDRTARQRHRSGWSTPPPAGSCRTVTPGADQRIAVAGGRVLTVTGTAQDGTCYYAIAATDPPSGRHRVDARQAEPADRRERLVLQADPRPGRRVGRGARRRPGRPPGVDRRPRRPGAVARRQG